MEMVIDWKQKLKTNLYDCAQTGWTELQYGQHLFSVLFQQSNYALSAEKGQHLSILCAVVDLFFSEKQEFLIKKKLLLF